MNTLTVTRRAAIACNACRDARNWSAEWLAEHGGDDDTPILLTVVLDDSPRVLDWALWALRCAEPVAVRDRIARLFAADCAERVVALAYSPLATEAIAVARRYATGGATGEELEAASVAAWEAARATARAAPLATARAAPLAAARAAARDAASAACAAASDAAPDASRAARDAAVAAARDTARGWEVAWAVEVAWQTDRLRLYLTGAELPPVEPVGVGGEGVQS